MAKKCLPHIRKNSKLGKELNLTQDIEFNTIQEIREFIDSEKQKINNTTNFANKKTAKEEVFHKAFNLASPELKEKLLDEGSKLFGIEGGESTSTLKYSQAQENEVKYAFKAVENIQKNITKVNQWYKQLENTDAFWNKVQQDLQISKDQINLLRNSEGTTIEEKLTSFVANYSYTVEINTAREKGGMFKRDSEGNLIDDSLEERNTQHYSNLTVPGGTNGSYIEANIETPMIVPSIQSHAQFKTENTIGWMRADEKQNYQEKDIDNLIETMKKSGILQVNCG